MPSITRLNISAFLRRPIISLKDKLFKLNFEYVKPRFVPFLEGKSSVGRLGIDIHAAGRRC